MKLRRFGYAVVAMGLMSFAPLSELPAQGPGRDPLVRIFDRDGDGEISAREIADADRALRRLDRNRDRQITRDELRRVFQGMNGRPGQAGRRGGPGSTGAAQLERAGLETGKPLPAVRGYDDQGNPFALPKDLRGQYTVLVFGCLT